MVDNILYKYSEVRYYIVGFSGKLIIGVIVVGRITGGSDIAYLSFLSSCLPEIIGEIVITLSYTSL